MKFSVIVPAYNAEKYIKECIESILAQSFKDYEIIIINDGSTDNTLQVLETYKNILNVVIIDSNNNGVFRARWKGIQQAVGEYLIFVDSDDCVCPYLLETIDRHLTDDIDLLQFSYFSFLNEKPLIDSTQGKEPIVYDRKEFLDEVVRKTIVNGSEAVVLWNKVYKRKKVLESVKDFPYSFLEDYVFNFEYYVLVHKYKKIFDKLYFYRSSPDSLSKRTNPNGFEILKQVDEIKSFILGEMGVNSLLDKQNAAAWFIDFLVNGYLFTAYKNKGLKIEEIKMILADEMVLKKSNIVEKSIYDSKNALQIRTNRCNKIISNFKIKILALKIKRCIKLIIQRKG